MFTDIYFTVHRDVRILTYIYQQTNEINGINNHIHKTIIIIVLMFITVIDPVYTPTLIQYMHV